MFGSNCTKPYQELYKRKVQAKIGRGVTLNQFNGLFTELLDKREVDCSIGYSEKNKKNPLLYLTNPNKINSVCCVTYAYMVSQAFNEKLLHDVNLCHLTFKYPLVSLQEYMPHAFAVCHQYLNHTNTWIKTDMLTLEQAPYTPYIRTKALTDNPSNLYIPNSSSTAGYPGIFDSNQQSEFIKAFIDTRQSYNNTIARLKKSN